MAPALAAAVGLANFLLQLGPFGGSHRAGTALLVWAGAYLVFVVMAGLIAFTRRDL